MRQRVNGSLSPHHRHNQEEREPNENHAAGVLVGFGKLITESSPALIAVVKLWANAGERRSPSLHDDSYLQHKQQKKMCV